MKADLVLNYNAIVLIILKRGFKGVDTAMRKKILLATIIIPILLTGCGKTSTLNETQQSKEQSPPTTNETSTASDGYGTGDTSGINTKTTQAKTTTSDVKATPTTNTTIDYTQYIKKTWRQKKITKESGISFCISKIENGEVTGKFTTVGPAPGYDNNIADFNGTISKDTASCLFVDFRGNKGNIKLIFEPNNEMEATIKITNKSQDTKAQPPEGTFQLVPHNIRDLTDFAPIEDQSFSVNLNSWGDVKFVSGKLTGGNHVPAVFYLTNNDDDILYDFAPDLPYDINIKAISFEDVNKDGLKDIIIIVGGGDGWYLANVYIQEIDGSFYNNADLNREINESGSNKDVKTILKFITQTNYY